MHTIGRAVALLALLSSHVVDPAAAQSADTALPAPLRIWKGTAPGSDARHWPRPDYREEWEKPGELIRYVTDPAVQVFLPDSAVNTGAAVVVCPGGRYLDLYINHEGWEVARELQKRGIAAIVLKYRHYDLLAAVEDAQRAVRFVRAHAVEWRINPGAVGIGGFSAGGHLSLNMARLLARPEPWPHDDIDRLSRRPDFLMLVYPAVGNLSPGGVIDSTFPPAFIALAGGDGHTPPGPTIAVFNRLVALHVPAELHVYQQGGHGFGPGTPECHCASWLDLFRDWLDARGLLRSPAQSTAGVQLHAVPRGRALGPGQKRAYLGDGGLTPRRRSSSSTRPRLTSRRWPSFSFTS